MRHMLAASLRTVRYFYHHRIKQMVNNRIIISAPVKCISYDLKIRRKVEIIANIEMLILILHMEMVKISQLLKVTMVQVKLPY